MIRVLIHLVLALGVFTTPLRGQEPGELSQEARAVVRAAAEYGLNLKEGASVALDTAFLRLRPADPLRTPSGLAQVIRDVGESRSIPVAGLKTHAACLERGRADCAPNQWFVRVANPTVEGNRAVVWIAVMEVRENVRKALPDLKVIEAGRMYLLELEPHTDGWVVREGLKTQTVN